MEDIVAYTEKELERVSSFTELAHTNYPMLAEHNIATSIDVIRLRYSEGRPSNDVLDELQNALDKHHERLYAAGVMWVDE